jgi:hypothetical protein
MIWGLWTHLTGACRFFYDLKWHHMSSSLVRSIQTCYAVSSINLIAVVVITSLCFFSHCLAFIPHKGTVEAKAALQQLFVLSVVRFQRLRNCGMRPITFKKVSIFYYNFVTNHTLHSDLKVPYVCDVIHEIIWKHHTKLEDHPNPLLEPLLQPAYNRRLNRCWPFDLQDTWGDIAGCTPHHIAGCTPHHIAGCTPHHVIVSRPHISLKIDCNPSDCW